MALQHRGIKRERGECSGDFTYYKLCESWRASAVAERDGKPCFWRVCADCEPSLRIEEWGSWPGEMRQCRGAEYVAEERVFKDFKRANMGKGVKPARS